MLVGDATGSLNFFRKEGWLDRKGFYKPSEVDWLPKIGDEEWFRKLWTLRVIWCGTYYFLVTVLGFAAIFSSIGGTLMQIIGNLLLPFLGPEEILILFAGVYRNALCYINTQYWLAPADQKPMAVLSTNSEEMIRNAISERSASTPTPTHSPSLFSSTHITGQHRDKSLTTVRSLDTNCHNSHRLHDMRKLHRMVVSEADEGYF